MDLGREGKVAGEELMKEEDLSIRCRPATSWQRKPAQLHGSLSMVQHQQQLKKRTTTKTAEKPGDLQTDAYEGHGKRSSGKGTTPDGPRSLYAQDATSIGKSVWRNFNRRVARHYSSSIDETTMEPRSESRRPTKEKEKRRDSP